MYPCSECLLTSTACWQQYHLFSLFSTQHMHDCDRFCCESFRVDIFHHSTMFFLLIHAVQDFSATPPDAQFLNVLRAYDNWYWELPTSQSIALLTSSCPLPCLLLPQPRSHQLLRKLIISFLCLTQDVVASMYKGGGVFMYVCVHECTCMHKPKHNDYSAITEVIKTEADLYQGRQRE